MTQPLPPRPNLEHLRRQAKSLLADWRTGDHLATQAFIEHLPKARGLDLAAARRASFRLADAQSVIARQHGFASWAALTRHVELLRALEGEWHFNSLQVDGHELPSALLGHSRLLFDGDRFRMDSPEGNYDGRFVIDTAATPMRLDIAFVEGPEAGNAAYAIWHLDGDALTICLGLVGAARPMVFATAVGSGHALEHLRRASSARPVGVDGGLAPDRTEMGTASAQDVGTAGFDVETNASLQRLEGEWSAVRLVTNGKEMPADWLTYGSRVAKGNEVKVVFGGQLMLHAKVRIDDTTTPIAIDYLHLTGASKGQVSLGIMAWIGEDVCILMASPTHPRPISLAVHSAAQTLSQWKRRE